jgi:predicted secreted protein
LTTVAAIMSQQDDGQPKPSVDAALRAAERRRAGARRTAWIIAAIAIAFFIASLVQGHLAGIPNWVPPH